jgi:hypothetical protein
MLARLKSEFNIFSSVSWLSQINMICSIFVLLFSFLEQWLDPHTSIGLCLPYGIILCDGFNAPELCLLVYSYSSLSRILFGHDAKHPDQIIPLNPSPFNLLPQQSNLLILIGHAISVSFSPCT